MDLRIGILNKSKEVSDKEVARHTPYLEAQVREHFEPLWGIGAGVEFFPNKGVPRNYMRLVLLDTSDEADAEGYHDLTPYGRAQSKVFCKGLGKRWTVTASHEILEMIADRYVNKAAVEELPKGGMRLYAVEVCDPVQEQTYKIGPTEVSNFVTEAWFYPAQRKWSMYDYLKTLKAPFTLAKGGYISVYTFGDGKGWHDLTCDDEEYVKRPRIGSRRERRRVPQHMLRKSIR
jgi:hypothetical protein